MSPGANATASIVLNGALRFTVKRMFEQGLDAEAIASALDVPLDAVLTCKPIAKSDEGARVESEEQARLNRAEVGLADYQDAAVNVIGELLDCPDSSSVRLAAAKMVLEGANGSLRPKQEARSTSNMQINLIFREANEIYREQLKRSGLVVEDVQEVETVAASPTVSQA